MLDIKADKYVYWFQKAQFELNSDITSFWTMYIIEKGKCEYKIGDSTGQANQNSVLICPPHMIFNRKVIEPITFHFFRFNFQTDLYDLSNTSGILTDASSRILDDCLIFQRLQFQKDHKSDEMRNHFLNDIFYTYMFSKQKNLFSLKYMQDSTTIEKAINYMYTNFKNSINIENVAANLGWSPAYFSRKFREHVGVCPVQYLEEIKLQTVEKMLINTDLTIEEIAQETGFSNGLYLSKRFTKYTKVSPSRFRLTHKV